MRLFSLLIVLLIATPSFARTYLYCHNGNDIQAEDTLLSLEIDLVLIYKFGTYTSPDVTVNASIDDLAPNAKNKWVMTENLDIEAGKDFISMKKNEENEIAFAFEANSSGIFFSRTFMKINDFEMKVTGVLGGKNINDTLFCQDFTTEGQQ